MRFFISSRRPLAQRCGVTRFALIAPFHLASFLLIPNAQEFYTNANNLTRLEDAQMARELDLKVLSAWVGHPKGESVVCYAFATINSP